MNQHLFKNLVELTTDAVFIVRVAADGHAFIMEYVNQAYRDKFGVCDADVVGKEFSDMLDADKLPDIRQRFMDCVQQNRSIIYEESFQHNDTTTTSLSEIFPINEAGGRVGYVVGISKDITELKRQRDLLIESEHTLQSIINSSDNVLIYVSKDYRILYANRKAQLHAIRMLGKELVIGEKMTDYYNGEELNLALSHVQQLITERKTTRYEHAFRYPDGEEVWFLRRYYGVWDKQEHFIGVVIASIDITERKIQELQIQKHANTLREIAKIQSHEIRRPVANIMGLTELIDLKDKSIEENELVLRYLRSSAVELDELINRIVLKTHDAAS